MDYFKHFLQRGLKMQVPESMIDANDALIVREWVISTLHAVFRNGEDTPSFADVKDVCPLENPEGHRYVELFVTNHCLREYHHPLPEGHFRFEVHQELNKPPVWYGVDLKLALVALLTLDTQYAVGEHWNNFFKQPVGA